MPNNRRSKEKELNTIKVTLHNNEYNMNLKRNAYRILVENQKERDHREDQDVGGWTILKWILER
jgi:hypothetical protein